MRLWRIGFAAYRFHAHPGDRVASVRSLCLAVCGAPGAPDETKAAAAVE